MNNLKISVVLCVYNEEDRVFECLQSLLKQTLNKAEYEVIVLDNESSDQTSKIVKRFIIENSRELNITCFRIKHVGLSVSRNTGIEKSKGEIIAFTDGDGKVDENWLKNILVGFEDEKVFVVSGKVENLNVESKFAEFIHKAHFQPSVSVGKSKLIGANMAFRKDVFELSGGFLNSFVGRGDETCVTTKFFEENSNKSEFHAGSAIAYNEHATSFIEWLNQQYQEGKNGKKIQRLFVKERLSILAKFILRLGFLTFIPHLIVYANDWFILIHFSLFFVRIFGRRRYLYESYKNVKRNYNFSYALKALMITLSGTIVADIAYTIESILPSKKMNTCSSSGEIIEVIS